MLLRTTRRLSTFSRTAALEGNLARREASSKLADTTEPPKLSRSDAIEGRLARREAAALLQGAAEPFTAADSASEMCAESDIIYTQTSVIQCPKP